jgi:hypothetical protein
LDEPKNLNQKQNRQMFSHKNPKQFQNKQKKTLNPLNFKKSKGFQHLVVQLLELVIKIQKPHTVKKELGIKWWQLVVFWLQLAPQQQSLELVDLPMLLL